MFGLKKKINGGDPRAFRQETGGAWGGYQTNMVEGLGSGLVTGTWVATQHGWRPVQSVAEGDTVLTFDNGPQVVRSVTRGVLWQGGDKCPHNKLPLMVPAGALGNQAEMILLAEQCVMLESDTADAIFGDPFAVLMASHLEGYRGISRAMPHKTVEIYQLHFDDDQMVYSTGGALVFCPSLKVYNVAELLAARPQAAPYTALSADEAAMLIECLINEEAIEVNPVDFAPRYAACA